MNTTAKLSPIVVPAFVLLINEHLAIPHAVVVGREARERGTVCEPESSK